MMIMMIMTWHVQCWHWGSWMVQRRESYFVLRELLLAQRWRLQDEKKVVFCLAEPSLHLIMYGVSFMLR